MRAHESSSWPPRRRQRAELPRRALPARHHARRLSRGDGADPSERGGDAARRQSDPLRALDARSGRRGGAVGCGGKYDCSKANLDDVGGTTLSEYGISCYKNGPTGPSAPTGQCEGRGFIAKSPCPDDVCTFPYGYVDPVNGQKYYSTQPPFALCSEVTSDTTACIGDDTIHAVMPKAYSWPNDPQVFIGNAPLYRVIFSPGGTPASAPPITPSGLIPLCSALPAIYDYPNQFKSCEQYVDKSEFAVAQPKTAPNPNWACVLPSGDSADNGVICRWKAPSLGGPAPGGLQRIQVPGNRLSHR
jgi:hypothetical protein